MKKVKRKCVICGNEFIGQGLTCSIKCRSEKTKKTNLEKYGGSPNKTKEVQEKRRKTCLNKYGVEHPLQTKEVQEKIRKTCLNKYGVEYYVYTDKLKKNWGEYNPFNSNEIQEKIRNTKKEKYNDEFYTNYEKAKQTFIKKYGVINPGQIPEVRRKVEKTCLEKYGVPYTCILNNLKSTKTIISNINKKFSEFLNKNDLPNELEYKLKYKSYDIHILNTNILIEINPTYTHNSSNDTIWNKKLNKSYHLNKTKLAIENNYQIINIFDWDDWDDVIKVIKENKFPKYKLKSRKNFYNRKTKDRIIDLDEKLNEKRLLEKGYLVIYDVI